MANLTPIPISSLPVIDDPTGDELIPVSAQGSDGAVRLSDVGGIGDISELPAATGIAPGDLVVISKGGVAMKTTAEQLKTFIDGDLPGETVTLTVDETGTLYSIPYSIVEPGDTHTLECYKLADITLTDAELLSAIFSQSNGETHGLVQMDYASFVSGSAYTEPGTWYGITGSTVTLAALTFAQGTTSQYGSQRWNNIVLLNIPADGAGYTAGLYATETYSRSVPSLTYTVGGGSTVTIGRGKLTRIVNKATGSTAATVTGLTVGTMYAPGNTFTVSCAVPCVVGLSYNASNDGVDDIGDYTELTALETGTADTYAFALPPLDGDFTIGIALLGDANGDGKVAPADMTRLQRYVANRETPGTFETNCKLPGIQLLAADADGSGYVTNHDAIRLQRYLAGTFEDDSTLAWRTRPTGLPAVTTADDGKVLAVVNGAWAVVDPATLMS